jgi:hypothetical protein
MPTFQTQIIRIAADTTSKENVLDLATASEPQAWWARDLTLQVGVFAGAALLDVSDLQSVTILLKDPGNLDGSPLVSKTIASFDNTTTLANWKAGANQHFSVAFDADELSFPLTAGARLVHLSMVAVTTGGLTGTICVGSINIIDDGGNSPGSNPVNAITVGQAQAMINLLIFNAAPIVCAATLVGNVGFAQPGLLGRAPLSVNAGAGGAFIASIQIGDVGMPGALLTIPIDFAASVNGTVNIYDATTAGTLLQTITNIDATAERFFLFTARFDGVAWHKEDGHWVD